MTQDLGEAFEVGPALGSGGFGTVYRARRRGDGLEVAIKVPSGMPRPEDEARWLREARLLVGVVHPGLARFHGAFRDRSGRVALVYELVEGTDLGTFLSRGRPSQAQALTMLDEIAAGLDALHGAGLIHRDLKPSNVMVTPEGRVKLIDFGLSRPARPGSTITRDGAILGTPAYAAPEQLGDGEIGPKIDLYAFGCLIYELLAGRPAFAGEPMEILRAKFEMPPTLPGLERFFDRALAVDPRERLPTATDLTAFLRASLGGGPALDPAAATVVLAPPAARPSGSAATPRTIAPGTTTMSVPPRGDPLRTLFASAVLGAALLGGLLGSRLPGKAADAARTGPAVAELEAELVRVRRAAETDPALVAGLTVHEEMPLEQVRDHWLDARVAFRKLTMPLQAPLRGLPAGTPSRAAFAAAAWLAMVRHVLDVPGRIEVGPLFRPEEDPDFEALVGRGLGWIPIPGFTATAEGWAGLPRQGEVLQALAAEGRRWTPIRGLAALKAEHRGSRLRGIDPLGNPFRSAARSLPGGIRDLYREWGGRDDADAPLEVAAPLAPVEGDLVLAVFGYDWNKTTSPFQLGLALDGPGGRLETWLVPPRLVRANSTDGYPVFGLYVGLRADLVPPGANRVRLTGVGLQAVGDSTEGVDLLEVHQLASGPVPPGLWPPVPAPRDAR